MERALCLGLCAAVVLSCEPSYPPEVRSAAEAKDHPTTETAIETALPSLAQPASDPSCVVYLRGPKAIGTGFVLRPDGWIATNHHVIATAGVPLVAVLSDGREFTVETVLADDVPSDLAIVHVQSSSLPAARLGNSDAIRPGDPVVVVGYPGGTRTVSRGIVRALVKANPRRGIQRGDHFTFSAPVDRGSSGSPVFDDKGAVIGVAALASVEHFGRAVRVRDLSRLPLLEPSVPYATYLAHRPTPFTRHCRYAEAAECSRMCESGELSSCVILGGILDNQGRGADADVLRAESLFARACGGGELYGCLDLGALLARGIAGRRPDPRHAAAYYERACDGGLAESCTSLARLLDRGLGVPRDAPRAHRLLAGACDEGSARACSYLAHAREGGAPDLGGDLSVARGLYVRACYGGEVTACPRARELLQSACREGERESCAETLRLAAAGDP